MSSFQSMNPFLSEPFANPGTSLRGIYGVVPSSLATPAAADAHAPATTLPSGPTEGQQAVLVDSTTTPTYAWVFQWSTAAAKWLFVGGSPALVAVETSETTGTTFPTDLATVGPSFTVPRDGTYLLGYGFSGSQPSSGSFTAVGGPKIGGATAAAGDSIAVAVPSATNELVAISRFKTFSGVAASTVVKLQFGSSASGTSTFALRWLSVLPVAVT